MPNWYLGLLSEPIAATLARFSVLRHMRSTNLGAALVYEVADAYASQCANERATGYVINTLLSVGSRRMGGCMRGEPWCDEWQGSKQVKEAWAAFKAAHA